VREAEKEKNISKINFKAYFIFSPIVFYLIYIKN